MRSNMEQSATLDIETLKITQEHYILASQSLHLPRPGCEGNSCEAGGPGAVYGWRKRGLYFFLLLLLVTMIVNLALTVWILKVMNFSMDGMGSLKLNQDGIRVEGKSEFLSPLYVNEIQSRGEGLLVLKSEKNVTLNARNDQGLLTGQLTVGPESVEAQCQRLEVRSSKGGRLLFTAEEEEVIMTTEKFTITGSEGAVFGHSVETPLILAKSTEDLKFRSWTTPQPPRQPTTAHLDHAFNYPEALFIQPVPTTPSVSALSSRVSRPSFSLKTSSLRRGVLNQLVDHFGLETEPPP